MDAYSTGCQIIEKLYQHGYLAYFAGGWVRDFLLGHPSSDIDIATSATPREIESLFSKTIPVGAQFGIVVVIEKKHQFEVATFRKDAEYKDGRRPISIELASPEEDAKRRDFTINGMFYDPIQRRILDYVNGQEDLNLGIIRAIGNPHERFLEDRLRMIRATRYAARFQFSIEEETLEAILDHAEDLFPAVSVERIWSEFCKMSIYPNFDKALIALYQLQLLPVIFPSLQHTPLEEIKKRIIHLPHFPKQAPLIARILELFPSVSERELLSLCSFFKLSNREKHFALFYLQALERLLSPSKQIDLYSWAQFYAHEHFSLSLQIAALHIPISKRQAFLQEHHRRKQQLDYAISKMQRKEPFLRACDLKKAGIHPGKKMGLLLKEGEKIAVNEELTSVDSILAKLRKHPLWQL